MSAVAGVASKVISALPVAGSIAKGAWNIGKKVVGGIKNIFTGGKKKAQEFANQAQGMVDTGRQMLNQGQDLFNQGRDIYSGFKQGGFSGGIDALNQRLPGMMQGVGGIIDSGRQMFNQGREMIQGGIDSGRQMFNQGREMIQGGRGEMQELMRRRRGGMIRPAVMP